MKTFGIAQKHILQMDQNIMDFFAHVVFLALYRNSWRLALSLSTIRLYRRPRPSSRFCFPTPLNLYDFAIKFPYPNGNAFIQRLFRANMHTTRRDWRSLGHGNRNPFYKKMDSYRTAITWGLSKRCVANKATIGSLKTKQLQLRHHSSRRT